MQIAIRKRTQKPLPPKKEPRPLTARVVDLLDEETFFMLAGRVLDQADHPTPGETPWVWE